MEKFVPSYDTCALLVLVIVCPCKLEPSKTTAAVLYGLAPVAKSEADVMTNEVGSPNKPVKLIEAAAVDSVTEEGDIYHKKVIHLSWVHEEKNGKIISIETGNEVDGIYEVRWYQRSAGAASPDEWAGVEWKHLTQDSEGNDLGPHAFEYTLIINQDSYNKPYEQIKAIIIYTPTSLKYYYIY